MTTLTIKEYQANLATVSRILQANPALTIKSLARLIKKKGSGYCTQGRGIEALKLELGLMLEQNPNLFVAERFDQVEMWSVRPPKEKPKSYAQRLAAYPKDFTYVGDGQPLIMGILKAHEFKIRFEDLYQAVMAKARQENFLAGTLNESLVRNHISCLLRRLENAQIIRLESMGEVIAARDLSRLKDWEGHPAAKKTEDKEPDFSDEAVIRAELEKREGAKLAPLTAGDNARFDFPDEAAAEADDDEDGDDVPDSDSVELPEAIKLALRRLGNPKFAAAETGEDQFQAL
jgi:hypothetical protein